MSNIPLINNDFSSNLQAAAFGKQIEPNMPNPNSARPIGINIADYQLFALTLELNKNSLYEIFKNYRHKMQQLGATATDESKFSPMTCMDVYFGEFLKHLKASCFGADMPDRQSFNPLNSFLQQTNQVQIKPSYPQQQTYPQQHKPTFPQQHKPTFPQQHQSAFPQQMFMPMKDSATNNQYMNQPMKVINNNVSNQQTVCSTNNIDQTINVSNQYISTNKAERDTADFNDQEEEEVQKKSRKKGPYKTNNREIEVKKDDAMPIYSVNQPAIVPVVERTIRGQIQMEKGLKWSKDGVPIMSEYLIKKYNGKDKVHQILRNLNADGDSFVDPDDNQTKRICNPLRKYKKQLVEWRKINETLRAPHSKEIKKQPETPTKVPNQVVSQVMENVQQIKSPDKEMETSDDEQDLNVASPENPEESNQYEDMHPSHMFQQDKQSEQLTISKIMDDSTPQ